jgi:hypothetical protein
MHIVGDKHGSHPNSLVIKTEKFWGESSAGFLQMSQETYLLPIIQTKINTLSNLQSQPF